MGGLEVLVLNVLLLAVAFYVLYVVVRRAVRDGMADAWAKREATTAANNGGVATPSDTPGA
ncbi:hypothetical protein [Demequina sp. NBRC 110055]|uniref:hypothetical protein n=1 Tax=Demequina sp. NBRC 110055 TaxID=1570344 RepID=UPI001186B42C|nr:hypothetical protein [Demequina sp. NBRC 110055]